jgi:hypothetical protein
MKITRPFFTVILLSTNLSFANIAQVIKLRGNATYLSNGMKDAKTIEVNQWLAKDTSILTNDKTFLVIKYKNGSEVTLGPKSKLIIDNGVNSEQQVVNLLMGKFKASVKNLQKNNENKMLIKTSGAALGIRGTEFQTSYNPETKITSLLTFHGAVAMAKIDQNKRFDSLENLKQIEAVLKEESVVVKTGEYSGTAENKESITAPVKISPEQFTKIQLTNTLGAEEEKIPEDTFQKELAKNKEIYAQNKTIKEDSQARAVQELRPGGFVDLNSGLYLPPTKDSKFDEKIAVYIPNEKIGSIDQIGNYEPPKGLTLDPVKGFIPEKTNTEATIEQTAKELNEDVVKQVQPKIEAAPIKKKKSLDQKDEDVYKKYYEPTKI